MVEREHYTAVFEKITSQVTPNSESRSVIQKFRFDSVQNKRLKTETEWRALYHRAKRKLKDLRLKIADLIRGKRLARGPA